VSDALGRRPLRARARPLRSAGTLPTAAAACAWLTLLVAAARPAPTPDPPPPGYTAGFGEPSCAACHAGAPANSGGGALVILGLPQVWQPGRSYDVTVRLTQPGLTIAGFQLAARFSDGTQAGQLAAAPLHHARIHVEEYDDVAYASQALQGLKPTSPDTALWLLRWTAPTTRAALTISFHASGNAANDDISPLGDLVYTTSAAVPPPK
jgi:hypothetical protein